VGSSPQLLSYQSSSWTEPHLPASHMALITTFALLTFPILAYKLLWPHSGERLPLPPIIDPADLRGVEEAIEKAWDTPSEEIRRNVIWIVTDDLGISDVGFSARLQGSVKADEEVPIFTPYIDALANRGARMKNYYAQPQCGPSRASLLTGRYPVNMGNPFPSSINFKDNLDWKNTVLPGDLSSKYESVGNQMQRLGYRTHFIGKWGIDSGGVGHGPRGRGFDTFFGLMNSGHNHYTKVVGVGGGVDMHRWNETVELDWPEVDEEPEVYSSTMFTREAVNVISQHAGTKDPFFLHLSYTAPHDPLQAPEEYVESPACVKHRHNPRRQTYCGMVQSVDIGVGDVTKALIKHDLLHKTIIMFTSDNGGAPIVGGYNYPFRGSKTSQWEGGVHVVGFIFAPGLVPDQVFDGLFHISDWSPTILSMVGGVHPQLDEIDGIDQSKALEMKGFGERESVVVDWNGMLNMTSIVERIDGVTWKLIAGSTMEIGLFCKEPVDKWSFNAEGSTYLHENTQVLRDYLSWLNKDLFGFEWSIHWDMTMRYDEEFGTSHSSMTSLPENMTSAADLFYNAPVTLERDRVWLFNLDTDRTETTNVAFQHKEIVNQIVEKYNKKFKNVDPAEGGIYFQLAEMTGSVHSIVNVAMLLMPVLKPLHAVISNNEINSRGHGQENATFLP